VSRIPAGHVVIISNDDILERAPYKLGDGRMDVVKPFDRAAGFPTCGFHLAQIRGGEYHDGDHRTVAVHL
jgi:hypothetical protein